VQALTHESFFKGENVFELGSQGDKFYIILEGEVGVMIPRTSN
jgi:CRP-like cAMP-binding protein